MLDKLFYSIKTNQELLQHVPQHVTISFLKIVHPVTRGKKWNLAKALTEEGGALKTT